MLDDQKLTFAAITAIVAVLGGSIGLFNAYKSALWKRAELANSYLKELSNNETLVFVCRTLEWNHVKLVIPTGLRPLISDDPSKEIKTIDHDRDLLEKSLNGFAYLENGEVDPRIQIYRTAFDDFLSWLCLISSALDRKLFTAKDVEDVGYWIYQLNHQGIADSFIDVFGYRAKIRRLESAFSYRTYDRDI